MPRKKKRPRTEGANGDTGSSTPITLASEPVGGRFGPAWRPGPPREHLGGPFGPAWRPGTSSNGGGGDVNKLSFNSRFAQKYDYEKRRELLAAVPAAVLANDGESSSDGEDEDEVGELLTKKIDRRIRDTLEKLQAKDPIIYAKDTIFFDDDDDKDASDADVDDKGGSIGDKDEGYNSSSGSENDESSFETDDEPVAGWDAVARAAEALSSSKTTLKDYVRENLLRDGRLSDSDGEDDLEGSERRNGRTVSFADKKEAETVKLGGGDIDIDCGNESSDADDNDCELFIKKEKSAVELAEEEKDFEQFLRKQKQKSVSAVRPGDELLLHSYLDKESTDEKERFLRDFVLNNGWMEGGVGAAPKPADYAVEVDLSRSGNIKNEGDESDDDIVGDDESDFDDQVDEFESRFNFRFEDPGGIRVQSHARTIDGSLRRPDERRKAARDARKERKQHEKVVKTEEIKQLKNMKKREIEARLVALQEAAGDGVDFSGIDLDADFDPDEFSKQMEGKFGDEYYAEHDKEMTKIEDVGVAVATEYRLKPQFGRDADNAGDDDDDAAPLKQDVDRLMDEYYNLDYEDIIGGTPIRFKYKKVDAETFNMNVDDILALDDAELNKRASLRYIAPYRRKSTIPKRTWKGKKNGPAPGTAAADVAERRLKKELKDKAKRDREETLSARKHVMAEDHDDDTENCGIHGHERGGAEDGDGDDVCEIRGEGDVDADTNRRKGKRDRKRKRDAKDAEESGVACLRESDPVADSNVEAYTVAKESKSQKKRRKTKLKKQHDEGAEDVEAGTVKKKRATGAHNNRTKENNLSKSSSADSKMLAASVLPSSRLAAYGV
jgi:protein KRI1